MRFAIVGSRTFNDSILFEGILWDFLRIRRGTIPQDTIISGGAKGADSLAKKYATEESVPYLEFPAEWDKYGKRAGYLRNQTIVDNCDMVLAFWKGVSKGTQDTIEKAKKAKKPTFIVYI
ncbi:hypothetical protein LCGC14_0681550 [marine sediment metagenome]|uniref:YspA cpYpsA-related SLOG domain-containing protein n=1 Tax=marine sediment metagenome TaxID=412755 RepID=A0A0F9QN28_9ZZZZ